MTHTPTSLFKTAQEKIAEHLTTFGEAIEKNPEGVPLEAVSDLQHAVLYLFIIAEKMGYPVPDLVADLEEPLAQVLKCKE